MASQKFEKFLTLVRGVPQPEHVDYRQIRVMLDKTGGRFPDGVAGTPVVAGGVPAEWVDAKGAVRDRVVLYLHGGADRRGFHRFPPQSDRAPRPGHGLPTPGARLPPRAPEHPHPAPVEDAVAAYRWLLDQGATLPTV